MTLSRYLLAGLTALSAAAAMAQRTPVPIVNFENVPVALSTPKALSLPQVQQALIDGATGAQWKASPVAEGTLEAVFDKGRKHQAVVTIVFDAEHYSVRYKDSVNLNFHDRQLPALERRTGPANWTTAGTGDQSMAALAASQQMARFAGSPEAPFAKADPAAVIHPFYEDWVHTLLDAVRWRLKAAP